MFAGKVAIVAGVALLLALCWFVREVLILVFIAAVLAAGIAPAVHRVRVLGRFYLRRNIPRGPAVLLVYFPFLIVAAVLAVLVLPSLVVETRELSAQLPMLVEENVLRPLDRYVPVAGVREWLEGGVEVEPAKVFGVVRGAGRLAGSVVAVLFMVAYMLIDAHRLRNVILLIHPPEVRSERRRTLTRIANRMSSWLSGQLVLCGFIGVFTFFALLLLRIPYALPLAILATLGELVPVIGPIVGTIPALAIALLHSRWQFWAVLVFAIVLQKVENLFIAPRVMARKVSITPLSAFIAFMIGASLLGVVGAVIAIPAAAIVHVAFEEIFVARRERRQDIDRAGTLLRTAD